MNPSRRPRRAKIAGGDEAPALTLTQASIRVEKLAYVLVVNRAQKYGRKKSHIVYIGTTKKGVDRIAGSIAAKAREALEFHGVNSVEAFVYSCRARRGTTMWQILERGLLLSFRERYGCLPIFNKQGQSFDWDQVEPYLSPAGLKNVIRRYEPLTSRRKRS
jgi:hypothetical protein